MTDIKTIDQAYYETQLDLLDVEDIGELYDPDKCPRHFLPFLATFYHADTYTTLLGEQYERDSIKDAWRINQLRGTKAALDEFAKNVGFTYSIIRTISGNPRKTTQIVICISSGSQNGIDITKFIERTIISLLPVLIGVNRVDICPHLDAKAQRASAGIFHTWTFD